ncbi:hypothetical protein AB0B50_23680 [Streptomyces sp. NPDC041068]|uniref:hypothetical protein n=1 Tax=Streptomyces sp. NPDC041068 TaxID=3155130 RepID=UPI0033DA292A
MDAELTALAAAGATALVQQMVTEGWTQARDRIAALFSRGSGGTGDADEEVLVGELEEARAEVVAARDTGDEETAADVQTEWRSRLRRRLAADPAAAAELRALLDELAGAEGDGAPGGGITYNNTNHLSGGVYHGTVIQAQNIGRLDRGN